MVGLPSSIILFTLIFNFFKSLRALIPISSFEIREVNSTLFVKDLKWLATAPAPPI